jgi:hypothetical protein
MLPWCMLLATIHFYRAVFLKKLCLDKVNLPVSAALGRVQGCQMVYFHTKNPNFGIFGRALEWKMVFLWPFGIFFYCNLLFVYIGI